MGAGQGHKHSVCSTRILQFRSLYSTTEGPHSLEDSVVLPVGSTEMNKVWFLPSRNSQPGSGAQNLKIKIQLH